MRFYLALYTHRFRAGEKMREELKKYRICGITFLVVNFAVSLMIFFMVYWNRSFQHHEITTITMAAYTFTSLFLAIRNIGKYRGYNSPVYSATRAISLAAACVSLLTLESTMLTTFGGDGEFRRIMLSVSGGAISVFIIAMAIYMIVQGTKQLRQLTAKEENNEQQRHV